jgi:hypothetical protein
MERKDPSGKLAKPDDTLTRRSETATRVPTLRTLCRIANGVNATGDSAPD